MPVQKITLEVETTDSLDEEEQAHLSIEILRAANRHLAAHLASLDSLNGEVKWEEQA
jgi:hypothetical protein